MDRRRTPRFPRRGDTLQTYTRILLRAENLSRIICTNGVSRPVSEEWQTLTIGDASFDLIDGVPRLFDTGVHHRVLWQGRTENQKLLKSAC